MTTPRPIVFFSTLPVWSMGADRGASSMARTLLAYVEAGCEVTLITSRPEPEIAARGVRVVNVPVALYRLGGRLPRVATVGGSSLEFPLRALRAWRRVRRELGDAPAVIYGYEISGALAARLAQRVARRRLPIVTRFQGVIAHEEILATDLKRLVQKVDHLLAYRVASDLCIMTNDGTRGFDVIRRCGNRPSRVLFMLNGVELRRPGLPAAPGRTVPLQLVTASRLVSWKRVDRAVDLVAELAALGVDCRLRVAGDGPELPALTAQAAARGVTHLVEFLGSLPNASIPPLISSAHFLVSMHDISNLANPILEASRNGVPVLSLADGSLDGVVTDGVNGVLGDVPADMATLARKMRLLLDGDHYAALRRSADAAGSTLPTWDRRMAAELLHVLAL